MSKKISQNNKILEYLKSGKRINPHIAFFSFGCLRLAARIADLENRGNVIQHDLVVLEDGTKYGEYWMLPEDIANSN